MLGRFDEVEATVHHLNTNEKAYVRRDDINYYGFVDRVSPIDPSYIVRRWKPTLYNAGLQEDILQFGGILREDGFVIWPNWYSLDNGKNWTFLNPHRRSVTIEESIY